MWKKRIYKLPPVETDGNIIFDPTSHSRKPRDDSDWRVLPRCIVDTHSRCISDLDVVHQREHWDRGTCKLAHSVGFPDADLQPNEGLTTARLQVDDPDSTANPLQGGHISRHARWSISSSIWNSQCGPDRRGRYVVFSRSTAIGSATTHVVSR